MPFVKGKSGNPGGQWRPGQSGNPGGRPKSRPFREALERILKDRGNGDIEKGYDVLAAAMVAKIEANGDVAAFSAVADRIEGKVPTPIGGTDELPSIKGFAWLDPTKEDDVVASDSQDEQVTEH